MNLYLRLFFMLVTAWFKSRISVLERVETKYRVLPNDLDLLGHMNNGRYFTITDIARIEMLIRAKTWSKLRKKRLYPVMAGETVQFRKPLLPWQKYSVVTRVLGWDERFFYVEHKFQTNDELHALMIVKVRVIGADAARFTPRMILKFTETGELPETNMAAVLKQWNESSLAHWREVA